ncbi:helix-turn-helix domain-containing protein [Lactococcus petauri]|uniref:helix-turn-helix domain-containing protein n=1 Tax=Lactococcus petauri TaxID=1940789 RepID=UPI0006220BCE|nr:helix-turn-helix domain-containing protein [Lactococcus petauri]KKF91294.1 polyketide synthase regulator [Lactococcus garvieae]MBD5823686.1 polyketide synthase regulator [Lactococcus petauri]MDG6136794.1 helix-turn-helix domain-containing protein [Lactococcus petauri]MDT2575283.1 helix-turn-helix domain-containing protein [Lactococcus petauri]MDT2594244.1 helix-turn-helix domain-containing protein [Lactococcus petauri]
MEIEKIKKLYRNVEKAELNQRERTLIALLSEQTTDFSSLPIGRFRILQFAVADFSELVENIKFILPDVIRENAEKQFVIEEYTGNNLSKSELTDSLKVLSQDMGEKLQYYLGSFVSKEQLEQVYQEETQFFQQKASFSESILAQGLMHVESLLLNDVRQELLQSPEDKELVRALYTTYGNQAAAAKLLYVHRNTLLNKVKKYEQKYGLQLVGSDLVLAFSLIGHE